MRSGYKIYRVTQVQTQIDSCKLGKSFDNICELFSGVRKIMDNNRTRICVCYLVTAGLISAFIYAILATNCQNMKSLHNLKREVEEIADAVVNKPKIDGSIEPKHLADLVDAILAKRLSGVWKDLHIVKKKLRNNDCTSVSDQNDTPVLDRGRADRVNYASLEFGAKIHRVDAKPVGGTNIIQKMLNLEYRANPPINMLKQSLDPGCCFAFSNGKAEVTIKLAKMISIESIEIAHITRESSPTLDVSNAPKLFTVSGVDDAGVESLFGDFQYDTSRQIEEYPVRAERKFKYVRFKFRDNHGNPEYTCVYRVAVYGRM